MTTKNQTSIRDQRILKLLSRFSEETVALHLDVDLEIVQSLAKKLRGRSPDLDESSGKSIS